MKDKIKEIEKEILDISIKVCKRNEGGMIIFGNNLKDFKFMVKQDIKSFNILDNPKTVESLVLQDGAVWVNLEGVVMGYGIMITKLSKSVINKGTRHASALSSSSQGNKVFVISEEENKIKIYDKGKLISQLDPLTPEIEKKTNEIVNVLESVGFGTLGTVGITTLIPSTGLQIIPGVIIFGSTYFLIKLLNKILNKK